MYEIKILKAVLEKNLEESLWMDTRTEKWISEAIEIYMMMNYAETFYPNMKLVGGLSKVTIKFFLLILDASQF